MPSMVQTTKASLMDAICTSDEMSDGKLDRAMMRWGQITNTRKHMSFYECGCTGTVLCFRGYGKQNSCGLSAEGKIVKYCKSGP